MKYYHITANGLQADEDGDIYMIITDDKGVTDSIAYNQC